MHIYNNKLEFQATIPYDSETINQNGIDKIYPSFKNDWWLTETKFNFPKIENGQLREKTRLELVYEGIEQLGTGEIILNDIITYVPCPAELLKPEWKDYKWTETATAEDLFNASVDFYNSELEFAGKATTELACGIITDGMFSEVKNYMKSIDPYTQQSSRAFSVQRPSIFDRYK